MLYFLVMFVLSLFFIIVGKRWDQQANIFMILFLSMEKIVMLKLLPVVENGSYTKYISVRWYFRLIAPCTSTSVWNLKSVAARWLLYVPCIYELRYMFLYRPATLPVCSMGRGKNRMKTKSKWILQILTSTLKVNFTIPPLCFFNKESK